MKPGFSEKKNNTPIADLVIPYSNYTEVTFKDYPVCSKLRDVKVRAYNYSLPITLDPNIYSDDEGYYIAWERCCRNDDIDNIKDAYNASMVLYMEFPSLKKYPQYSSPEFSLTQSEYICLDKDFTFKLNATDTDNDQLNYKIVTPINGYNNLDNYSDLVQSGPYPLVQWLSGFSENEAIPGTPSLIINSTTGEIKVKASETGLFVFSIECTELRNGIKIGLTRLDFQFPVVDCSLAPPAPLIKYNNVVMPDIEHCATGDALLETDNDPTWFFQWQKDGVNIPNATSSTLATNQEGIYKVIKSYNSVCAKEIESADVKLTICERDLQLYIPTAFSPNKDGLNDELEIFGKSVDTFIFVIYNRWGEIVFESNTLNTKWNGGWKNDLTQPLPMGQYNYVVIASFSNGEKFERRDMVSLLR
ncbi:T9SS type B sorting domain-containing protein [Emticicia agri]|uniref:T9SS type B sorting domain-containing protein n=1 Tax=Emticicia agri TaxID=2492393 RepID=A0A4Q5LYH6_9BACT|nr:gliding motility-associated C-terminal domain-containing protein [Emticicia agri]RYU94739.1 T9SS type B sorting domain-containing protein [Emticicia agri]